MSVQRPKKLFLAWEEQAFEEGGDTYYDNAVTRIYASRGPFKRQEQQVREESLPPRVS